MPFSVEWFVSLAAIIVIDLLLAGDNAVVIALAARRLPPRLQKRAIWAGTFGAIAVRVALVLFALQLLNIGGIRALGGALLFAVAYNMLETEKPKERRVRATDGFWSAMATIIVADTVMGVDNILAIAGASRGDYWLVTIGLLVSIPIMVGGSVLILKWIEKMPFIITAGCLLLAGIAVRMILDDKWLAEFSFLSELSDLKKWLLVAAVAVAFTWGAARIKKRAAA